MINFEGYIELRGGDFTDQALAEVAAKSIGVPVRHYETGKPIGEIVSAVLDDTGIHAIGRLSDKSDAIPGASISGSILIKDMEENLITSIKEVYYYRLILSHADSRIKPATYFNQH